MNTDPDHLVAAPLRHHQATVNGVRLHYVEAGEGPLLLLLHGFPEFWLTWRHQIPALVAAGFRVVAPDLRGYNRSEKPEGVKAYRLPLLRQDVAGLIRHLGAERAHVVGHDWGGTVAWQLAIHQPERVERLAVLNAPHPVAFQQGLRNPTQLVRSLYAFFFLLPWLPEALSRARNFAAIERAFRTEPVRAGAYSDEEIEAIKQALAQPGALTAALNYYRAGLRYGLRDRQGPARRLERPTLLIWGEQDRYLGLHLTEGYEQWIADFRLERIPDASHWVQHDAPERVNQLLVPFLRNQ